MPIGNIILQSPGGYVNRETKSSEEWSKDPKFSHITILDPDGWDRQNYEQSWFIEKISAEEYDYRMTQSTIMWYPPKTPKLRVI